MQSALSTGTPTSPAPLNEKCNSHLAIAGAANALTNYSGKYRADQGVEGLFDAALNGATGVSIQTGKKPEKSGSWSLGKIIGTVGGAAAVVGGGAVLADTIGDNPLLAQQVIKSATPALTSTPYDPSPDSYSSAPAYYDAQYEDDYYDEEEAEQPHWTDLAIEGMNRGLKQSMPIIEDMRRREAEQQAKYDADMQRLANEMRAEEEHNARMMLLQQQAAQQAREQQRMNQQTNSSGTGSCVSPPRREGRNNTCDGIEFYCSRRSDGGLQCCIEGQTVTNQNGTVDFLLSNYCENPVEVQVTPRGSTSGQVCTKLLIPSNATRTYKQRAVSRSLNDINTCGCGGISWIETERPSKPRE